VVRPPGSLLAAALVAALLGGLAALGIGKAAGWLDGEGETVVVPVAASERGSDVPLATAGAGGPIEGAFDPAQLYRERAAGVVTIYALFGRHAQTGEGAASQGSGFVVSGGGIILTNAHVVTTAGEGSPADGAERASDVVVEFHDGARAQAEIVGVDVFADVAVLRIDPEGLQLRPVPLGSSVSVEVGEPVAAIGSPFGNAGSLTVGVVSAVGRSIESLTSCYELVDAVQTDAPINRGNSGGPLFDATGLVIGVNAQIRSSSGENQGVGFAVPIDRARRSMEQILESGAVRYAWIGVTTQTLTPSLAVALGYDEAGGAVVEEVIEDSPAEAAGLRGGTRAVTLDGQTVRGGGDLIVAIGGRAVASSEDLVRAITLDLGSGETVDLVVIRDGKRQTMPLTLGERPAVPPGC
jgi:S1-C subfamily serine protease